MDAIAELFRYFVEDPGRLPDAYAERAKEEPPQRVVCDYIAGMTDVYFNRVHREALG